MVNQRDFDAAQRAHEAMTPEDVYGVSPCDGCDDRPEDGDTSFDRRRAGEDDHPTDCACPGINDCPKYEEPEPPEPEDRL